MKSQNNLIVPFSILAGSIIIAVIIGASAFLKARGFDNTLSVTGSATQRVVADTAKWSFSFSRQATESNLARAYSQIADDLSAARKFLNNYGVKEENIKISQISTQEMYKYDSKDAPRSFDVRQTVTVQSNDPKSIETLSRASSELSSQGILILADQPQYYVSKLPDLRVALLGAALSDARNRAEQISGSAGTKVGPLKSASSGVVQVLSPNSIDISDYGQYDTFSIDKDVMVTVRATFFVK